MVDSVFVLSSHVTKRDPTQSNFDLSISLSLKNLVAFPGLENSHPARSPRFCGLDSRRLKQRGWKDGPKATAGELEAAKLQKKWG